MAVYSRDGITFQYPDSWLLAPEDYESGWAVTVSSPATAFLSLTLDTTDPPINVLADAALEALAGEYKEIESQPVSESLANRPAVGYDVHFFAMDLTNSSRIRALSTTAGTLLVFWEANDLETHNLDVLNAICVSLKIDDE